MGRLCLKRTDRGCTFWSPGAESWTIESRRMREHRRLAARIGRSPERPPHEKSAMEWMNFCVGEVSPCASMCSGRWPCAHTPRPPRGV